MNDLPDPTSSGDDQSTSPTITPPISIGGISSKEVEISTSSLSPDVSPLKDAGASETTLPKEVISAGVKTQTTTVTLPPKVSQMGVKQAGSAVSAGTGASVTLLLTDDQITQGLKQSVSDSWKWLAVWCIRKFKQIVRLKKSAK